MLRYVTTNAGKVREALSYLDDDVTQLDFDYTEVQASDLGPIAAHGAREAYRYADEPVLVDDAGLFIDGFEGFPGPYSSYVEDTLGVEAVRRLAAAELDEPRRASFRCVLAYCDGEPFEASPDPIDRDDRTVAAARGAEQDTEETEALPVKLFTGSVNGRIVPPRGEGGFGYDPIFEHDGATFAEMSAEEKNGISHRGRALAKFATWFAERTE
ncbi:non-canonical purine NTP pyrophosphatase [Haloferax sulfurifontis]|uniref:Ham1 family protein n=1 Tax=Haloferax sulfurifontis ATCC BAA-897 TaxID=662480 RepID=M0HXB1_9EURY|nr:non-canonical purine NTP pyrophosphatase [Haloferax sulfurifontis]ELZ89245.1 Ham1 family protein [Haloferax sulfurifontis ATCC BAA-897]